MKSHTVVTLFAAAGTEVGGNVDCSASIFWGVEVTGTDGAGACADPGPDTPAAALDAPPCGDTAPLLACTVVGAMSMDGATVTCVVFVGTTVGDGGGADAAAATRVSDLAGLTT